MKIAYIVPSLKNAGPVLVVKDLVTVMCQHGHWCEVFYFDDIRELTFDCPVKRINLKDRIPFELYDVVHTHGFRPQLYVFLHRPFRSHTRFVTTMHNYLFTDFRYTYGKVKGLIYGTLYMLVAVRTDKVIALTKDAQSYYSRFFGKKQVTYAYNTRLCDISKELTEEEKRQVETFRGDRALLGTSCALSPLKGLDSIIQSLQGCPPNIAFCIVGDGKIKSELQALAQSIGVSDRVLFVGYKTDAYRYLPYFDVFTIPSYSEGFPLALLEAAAYGKPTVASNLDVFKEIFTEDEITIFDLKHPETLPKCIMRTVNEKDKLGSNIKKKYESCYSPECFYRRHLEIYTSSVI